MSQADEDELNATSGEGTYVSKEVFQKMKREFDFKKLQEIILRKDNFVMKKETDVQEEYEFEKELGKGTFGEVYLGTHKTTGEK